MSVSRFFSKALFAALLIASAGSSPAAAGSLRVVTYNIHSGLGPSFALWQRKAVVEANLETIADTIVGDGADGLPDVIGLNEVDFGSRRSGWINQARFLADALERRSGLAFAAIEAETWTRQRPGFEVSFGNALLVRHPVRHAAGCVIETGDCGTAERVMALPAVASRGFLGRWFGGEPRGFIRATLDVGGREVDVVLTHLDAFAPEQREAQAAHLVARFVDPLRTTILLGDVNAVPAALTVRRRFFENDRTYDLLTAGPLVDARADPARYATFPAAAPVWPLDGVFASRDLNPRNIQVIGGLESDHRGLSVVYVFDGENPPTGSGPARALLEPASWRSASPSSPPPAH